MDVPVSLAKAQLTDLVKRAEAGEDVVLTRFGQPVARLVAAERRSTPEALCLDRMRHIARTFSTTPIPACPLDRRRYVGADGDRYG